MPETMVEKVARALGRRTLLEALRSGAVANAGSPVEVACAASGAEDDFWPQFVDDARAAITALMEPTPAMEVAFISATTNRWATRDGIRDGLRAMIQAAFSEGQG
jgi:hypothetical protein